MGRSKGREELNRSYRNTIWGVNWIILNQDKNKLGLLRWTVGFHKIQDIY